MTLGLSQPALRALILHHLLLVVVAARPIPGFSELHEAAIDVVRSAHDLHVLAPSSSGSPSPLSSPRSGKESPWPPPRISRPFSRSVSRVLKSLKLPSGPLSPSRSRLSDSSAGASPMRDTKEGAIIVPQTLHHTSESSIELLHPGTPRPGSGGHLLRPGSKLNGVVLPPLNPSQQRHYLSLASDVEKHLFLSTAAAEKASLYAFRADVARFQTEGDTKAIVAAAQRKHREALQLAHDHKELAERIRSGGEAVAKGNGRKGARVFSRSFSTL